MRNWDMESDWTTPTIACGACGQTKEEAHLTLHSMCQLVLGERLSSEKDLSGEKRFARVELGLKIQGDSNPDLNAKQRALLQRLIAARYSNDLLVYQAHNMLEGEDKKIRKADTQ
jgi:hypothetical protein